MARQVLERRYVMSSDKPKARASVLLLMFDKLDDRAEEARVYDVQSQTLTHRQPALMSPVKHHKEK